MVTIQFHPLALFMKNKKKQGANQILSTQFFRNCVLIKSHKRTDWKSEIHTEEGNSNLENLGWESYWKMS